jgi:flagellar hook assembly protein FlgD
MHEAADAALGIYDVAGRLVARPFEGHANAGEHEFVWDGTGTSGTRLPSGVYFYRFDSAGQTARGRLVLAR